ncbi:MAG: peptide chain release factor N(5)-glutamine methyltransferase [Spirochaetaceae bacterium]|jgi:release factor glutamine methyltransferase|nr:peptide chain release factor N(5)-glutamine methyltransferase [Spirochaetaceae bacterium]
MNPGSISNVLRYGKTILAEADIETSAIDAALLLAHALSVSKTYIYAHTEEIITSEQHEQYIDFLNRRLSGLCTAYIIRRKEFRFLNLYVDENVLVPRPDTETLVEAVLDFIDAAKDTRIRTLLDMCTGSGAVALALKQEYPALDVTASDISLKALEIAARNAVEYGIEARFVHSNLFQNITNRFDIITANAPYIPAACIAGGLARETGNEPVLALNGGHDGMEIIRKIVAAAPEHLTKGGSLFLEASPGQICEIARMLKETGFEESIVRKDIAGLNRVIWASLKI